MSNLNINRTGTDTGDNVRYSHTTPRTDYKGITLLLVGIIVALTVIWLIVLAVAKAGCYFDGDYECTATTYIFWGYVALLTLGLTPAIMAGVSILWERAINMRFLQWRGIYTHRDDMRHYAPSMIHVAETSAKSEATAGMDTYSPSTTELKKPELKLTADSKIIDGVDDEDNDIAPISLGDL